MLRQSFTALLLATVALPTFTSCVVSTGSRHTFSGKHLDDAVLRRVGSGESKELVLTIFGPPSHKIAGEDGTEVWAWEYRERTEENSFPLLSSGPQSSEGAVYVEFDGRTVVRVWRS